MTPDEQLYSKILTAVSPSNIGEYASCPMRLVLDVTHPHPFDPIYLPYSSFGTVAHYEAQKRLIAEGIAVGIDLRPPDAATIMEARKCQGIPGDFEGAFNAHVARVAEKAAETLKMISPLPRGTHWIVEKKSYNPSILPSRLGRKGNVSGFGGSIDVLRSDRKVLWDFKFVGESKMPKPPTAKSAKTSGGLSNVYLWQMASYHITENVDETGILWVQRSGESAVYVSIDWTKPAAQAFASTVRNFLNFISYKDFHKMAWPSRGDSCKVCSHAGKPECPAYCTSDVQSPSAMVARRGLADLMDVGAVEAEFGQASTGGPATGIHNLFN